MKGSNSLFYTLVHSAVDAAYEGMQKRTFLITILLAAAHIPFLVEIIIVLYKQMGISKPSDKQLENPEHQEDSDMLDELDENCEEQEDSHKLDEKSKLLNHDDWLHIGTVLHGLSAVNCSWDSVVTICAFLH